MYSIAKLLSDEPKKLEAFILTLLKVFCTVWISQSLFGFKPDLSNITIESFFRSFRVDESMYFVLTAFGVWYLLWELTIELLVELFIIWLSKIGKPENTLKWYLRVTNSIKMKEDVILDTKPHVLHFTESIQDENEDYPFIIETRANQIFSVGLVCFILLLTSSVDLKNWQIILSIFLLVNFLVISAAQRKLHDYYIEFHNSIRAYYYPVGQFQKLKNVLNQIEPISTKYKVEPLRKRIVLNSKSKVDFLPEEIIILPLFSNNDGLTNIIIEEVENNILKGIKDDKLHILCSNFYSKEKHQAKIQDNVYCINGETQNEIYQGFEELFYVLRKKHYNKKRTELMDNINSENTIE